MNLNKYAFGNCYESSIDKKLRKKYGTFYTPSYIVDYIIEGTMGNVDVLKNPFLKIIDPSCGCGYFLLGAYEFLLDKFSAVLYQLKEKFSNEVYKVNYDGREKLVSGFKYWSKENIPYHIISKCIYGADIDNSAVCITISNLSNISGIKKSIINNIVCCNSIVRWNKKSGFEKLAHFWSRKYDYVIGNPPWVSLSRKFKNHVKKELAEYYIDTYHGNRYLPNLYEYFIKRSMEIFKKGGRIGFVLPDRFAYNLQYRDFRDHILRSYNIVQLSFKVEFPGIKADTMIFIIENKYEKSNRIKIDVQKGKSYYVEQLCYMQDALREFFYASNGNPSNIKCILEKESIFLGNICNTFTGFIGIKKFFTKTCQDRKQIKIIKGRNIKKYAIKDYSYYYFNRKNIIGGTKDINKLAYKNKIVIRKTGKNLIAAMDRNGYIVEQSLYGIILNDSNFSLEYILAILNSRLIQWYYANFLCTNSTSIPQIKKYSLDRIPVKKCDLSIQNTIGSMVESMLDAPNEKDEEFIQEELDSIICKLYGIDLKDIKN